MYNPESKEKIKEKIDLGSATIEWLNRKIQDITIRINRAIEILNTTPKINDKQLDKIEQKILKLNKELDSLESKKIYEIAMMVPLLEELNRAENGFE